MHLGEDTRVPLTLSSLPLRWCGSTGKRALQAAQPEKFLWAQSGKSGVRWPSFVQGPTALDWRAAIKWTLGGPPSRGQRWRLRQPRLRQTPYLIERALLAR